MIFVDKVFALRVLPFLFSIVWARGGACALGHMHLLPEEVHVYWYLPLSLSQVNGGRLPNSPSPPPPPPTLLASCDI